MTTSPEVCDCPTLCTAKLFAMRSSKTPHRKDDDVTPPPLLYADLEFQAKK